MKRVNVYDRVNRERLLGTMDRWSAPKEDTRYNAVLYGCPVVYSYRRYDPAAALSVEHVTFERVTKVSKDGWEAEVVVVTDAPLSALVRLKDFRPAFDYTEYDGVRMS